jgi:membrane associated rhomboid family serine protease
VPRRPDYILARMIPVRDVIPSRTAPGVTLALIGTLAASAAWPEVREWWLPWVSHAVLLWLAGSTVEDRLGHARFAGFAAACAAAALIAPLAAGRAAAPPWVVCGAVAGVAAAYAAMFPRSRVLMLVPVVVGVEMTDVPAWVIIGLWAIVQAAAAWSSLTWSAAADAPGITASVAAGAAAGVLAGAALRRPERMRVDWWDPPTRRS